MQTYDDLIDRAQIVAAQAKLATAHERLGKVSGELELAKATHQVATQKADAAFGGDGTDPHAASAALDAAAKAVDVASRVRSAAEAGIATAEREFHAATGRAHQPRHDAAVAAAIEACRLADEGRAMVVAAELTFREAVAAIRSAIAHGAAPACPVMDTDSSSPSLTLPDAVWKLPTEAEMRKRLRKPAA